MTINDILLRRASNHAEAPAYIFVDAAGNETVVNYGELARKAKAIAVSLQIDGLGGERVLLLYPPGLDYVAGFLGCLLAGSIAVPAYPPGGATHLERLCGIAADCQAKATLTTPDIYERIRRHSELSKDLGPLRPVFSQTLDGSLANEYRPGAVDSDSLAFLQYTSGSTATPRGVMITHGNILHNQQLIQQAFDQSSDSIIVSWLPPYHDMGLIGGILQPLYVGAKCVLMAPAIFLRRPVRWLEAISRHKASTSGGPNFGYEHCVRHITEVQKENLDLSTWTAAFNGAEPVRAETLDRFTAAFSRCGFRREAFYPCYGLAEGTLLVAGGMKGACPKIFRADRNGLCRGQARPAPDDTNALSIVSCGNPLGGQVLAIVDPETQVACQEGEVGEVWVAGPSVAQGYWNNCTETERVFTRWNGSDKRFLRTGDTGFLKSADLYLVGRIKEILIIRGQNWYPQDIEALVESCHPEVRAAAAFGIEIGGEERLALALEVEPATKRRDFNELLSAVRITVAEQLNILAHAITLLRPAELPRTTSGKIRRGECRNQYLAGQVHSLASRIWEDAETGDDNRDWRALLAAAPNRGAVVTEFLSLAIARRLGVAPEQLDRGIPLVQLGLDSLMTVAVLHSVERTFGVCMDLGSVLGPNTVQDLAVTVAEMIGPVLAPAGTMGENSDRAWWPASSDQERLWMVSRMHPESCALNLQVAYRLRCPLDATTLERTIGSVAQRHSILRTTFSSLEGVPVQMVAPLPRFTLRILKVDSEEAIDRVAHEEAGFRFNLESGPLFRPVLLELGTEDHVFLLTVHHIICDAISLGVFTKEVWKIYQALESGEEPPLMPAPIQFGAFAARQREVAIPEARRAYWRRQLAGCPRIDLPLDHARPTAAEDREAQIELAVEPRLRRALQEVGRGEAATLFMTLFAVFQVLLSRYCAQEDLVTGVPYQNRRSAEVGDAIGLFAYPLPIRTQISDETPFRRTLTSAATTLLEAFANDGVPYLELVRLGAEKRDENLSLPVMFGFLPRDTGQWEWNGQTLRPIRLKAGTMDCDLFCTWQENGDALRGTLLYKPEILEESTVRAFAESYLGFLEQVAKTPDIRIGDLQFSPELRRRLASREVGPAEISISASFTAEPIRPALSYLFNLLEMPVTIRLTPAGQVFQQLLDTRSRTPSGRHSLSVALVRASDFGYDSAVARNLAAALASASEGGSAGVVFVCPEEHPDGRSYHWEHELQEALAGCRNVRLIPAWNRLAVSDRPYFDSRRERLGNIPYTDEFFAELGCAVARHFCAVVRAFTAKVVVLDCDNTLWKGVCGEDGPAGVKVTPGHQWLQHFLLAQQRAGILLCLCSKNNPQDIDLVFRENMGMILKPDDFAAVRVNWLNKSQNVADLARSLRLGLDTFVFVDDDPLQCAEVHQAFPEVLVVQLPSEEAIPGFFERLWAFDRLETTDEGRARTRLYQQEAAREAARQRSFSIAEFLADLHLEITISEITPGDLPRVAELIGRTNQFNVHPRRRSGAEIGSLLESGRLEGQAVRVVDRFGAYGLVGVLLYGVEDQAVEVDTFLLSCRVLGRGVEHQMAAWLGALALRKGRERVDVLTQSTGQNLPAREFLECLASTSINFSTSPNRYTFDARELSKVRYESPDHPTEPREAAEGVPPAGRLQRANWSALARIAADFESGGDLLRAIRGQKTQLRSSQLAPYREPVTSVEKQIAALAEELLNIEGVGLDDTFFGLGGDSLLATQMMSRLEALFEVEMSVGLLFDFPTVSGLAQEIERTQLRRSESAPIPPYPR